MQIWWAGIYDCIHNCTETIEGFHDKCYIHDSPLPSLLKDQSWDNVDDDEKAFQLSDLLNSYILNHMSEVIR